MKLSVIIPAHNEAATIQQVLTAVFNVPLPGWEREILVVNDASTDATAEILRQLRQSRDFIFLNHQTNLGKGAAIKTALSQATGDYVIIQDADLEYNPKDIPNLLSLIHNREEKLAVFGARGDKQYPERGFHYIIGAKFLTWMADVLFFTALTDLYTCYKLIPTVELKNMQLQASGFEFEAEVACKLRKRGFRLVEVPISYKPRSKQQGKHIGLKDAFLGFWVILKNRVK